MKTIIKILFLGILIGVTINISTQYYNKKFISSTNKNPQSYIENENPFDNLKERLPFILYYLNVQHPDVVYAQAILETGHFKSRVCREYNNLFGLYNSRTQDYYKFNHWSESIIAYINLIQSRYKSPMDYYEFLDSIGYAEDPEYIPKLKRLVKQYDKRRITNTISVPN